MGQTHYQPAPVELWRVPEAIAWITWLLVQQPAGLQLTQCLPAIAAAAADRPLRLRVALASTLLACLELAREGVLEIEQASAFGPVMLKARAGATNQQDAAA